VPNLKALAVPCPDYLFFGAHARYFWPFVTVGLAAGTLNLRIVKPFCQISLSFSEQNRLIPTGNGAEMCTGTTPKEMAMAVAVAERWAALPQLSQAELCSLWST
jgi:hypothetical protein